MKHANKVNMQFVYTHSTRTNVAKTIDRERRRLKAEKEAKEEAQKAIDAETAKVVTGIKARR